MMDVGVYRLPMAGPDDVSELAKLIDNGTIRAEEVCAIIAQTEGDGYARGYAAMNFELMLSERLGMSREEVSARIPMLMIGLTGGLMSPHYTVFTRREVDVMPTGEKRLALGIKITRVLKPEEYGTAVQARLVAEAVREAMKEAGIERVEDVCCVEVKCPNLTAARLEDARSRGKKCCSTNFAEAGSKSKGASALGVALGPGRGAGRRCDRRGHLQQLGALFQRGLHLRGQRAGGLQGHRHGQLRPFGEQIQNW